MAFKTLVSVTNPGANRPSSISGNDIRSFHNFSVRNVTLNPTNSVLSSCFTSNTFYSQRASHCQQLNMSTVLYNLQSRDKKSEWKHKRFSIKQPEIIQVTSDNTISLKWFVLKWCLLVILQLLFV